MIILKKIKNLIIKYQTFLKYISISLLSFLIDISFFHLFNLILGSIIIATILARVISSLINFLLNKRVVFQNKKKHYTIIIKYFSLVILQMFISAFLVKGLSIIIPYSPTLIKVPVEFMIFIVNYLVQKFLIFKK